MLYPPTATDDVSVASTVGGADNPILVAEQRLEVVVPPIRQAFQFPRWAGERRWPLKAVLTVILPDIPTEQVKWRSKCTRVQSALARVQRSNIPRLSNVDGAVALHVEKDRSVLVDMAAEITAGVPHRDTALKVTQRLIG